jgi:hypothetical protein
LPRETAVARSSRSWFLPSPSGGGRRGRCAACTPRSCRPCPVAGSVTLLSVKDVGSAVPGRRRPVRRSVYGDRYPAPIVIGVPVRRVSRGYSVSPVQSAGNPGILDVGEVLEQAAWGDRRGIDCRSQVGAAFNPAHFCATFRCRYTRKSGRVAFSPAAKSGSRRSYSSELVMVVSLSVASLRRRLPCAVEEAEHPRCHQLGGIRVVGWQ